MKKSFNQKKRSNPGDFLKQSLGKLVQVKLNDNQTFFKGILSCLDGTMNILLTNAKQLVNGQVKMQFKQILIRGNNVMYLKKAI